MAGQSLFGTNLGTDGRVLFMGLPFAQGSEASNGCQQGPAIIRGLSSSYNIGAHQFIDARTNESFLTAEDVSDLGDLQFRVQHGSEKYLQNLSHITASILEKKKSFFYVGGDHLATWGTIRGIADQVERFQIIHLDAHRDFRSVPEGEFPSHANFMSFVEALPQVARVIQLGLRGFDAVTYTSQKRVEIADDVNWLSHFFEQLIPGCPVFLTIDTDAFDPLIMPAVNFPVPSGLNPRILPQIFDALAGKGLRILGCDWMEYNPEFDSKNKITGHQILHLIAGAIKMMSRES